MRAAHHALFGLIALSCATEETALMGDGVGFPMAGTGGTEPGSAGSGGGSAPVGGGGMATTAGTDSIGGTFGFSGGTPVGGGGTFSTLGGEGGTMAGATMGGAGGAGGKGGSGGTGGKAGAGGTGGKGGAGGTGGGQGTGKCGDPVVPARTQWKASASAECSPTCPDPNGPFTAIMAVDGDAGTRFATGATQTGGEWLQIDLGAAAAINRLTINTAAATDYTRHYQVRVSNTSGNMAAAVAAEGDGVSGTTNITLANVATGRYVLITQTGTVAPATSWWSINEITVTCQ